MRRHQWITVSLAALSFATPALGQADAWQRKWYWGAEVGIYSYKDALTSTRKFVPSVGGHWMITGRRSALMIAFDQVLFKDSTQSAVADASAVTTGGIRLVNFTTLRRIQAEIFAVPMDGPLQVMLGGGFTIHQITNAQPLGPFGSLQESQNASNVVSDAATKAYVVYAVGAQYRISRLAVFAIYNYMPSTNDFLITSDSHTLTAGIRYSLTSAHEDVTSAQR
jgi:hypothetical protein